MIILDSLITDRGSKYALSGGPCHSADEARMFLAELKSNKKFAKATHNSWGLICGDQMIKNDDGGAGAGMVILRMLEGDMRLKLNPITLNPTLPQSLKSCRVRKVAYEPQT